MTLKALYTTTSGPGDSAAQIHPSHSLGGFASTTEWSGGVVGDLFGPVSSADAITNRADHRALYLYNPDPAAVAGLRIYVSPVTAGGTLSIGVDPRPVTHVDSLSPQAVDVSTAYLIPAGVTFSAPTNYTAGVVIGDLPGETSSVAGAGRSLWIKRTPSVTPAAAAESCDLIAESLTGIVWTRRIYWQVEPPIAGLSPPAPQKVFKFVPTASPFVRIRSDFLSTSGARITWDLDATLRDPGPYTFQLQTSRSGVVGASDWIDTGAPVQDAAYLTDVGSRLWGMTSDVFYRVLLTTTVKTYTSPVTGVFGVMGRRDWLMVQEIIRKERMYQREFVGANGFLLKARRYGTRCVCVNQTTGEVNNSSCVLCFGTGIVGGYHEPIPTTFATTAPKSYKEIPAYNENLGTVRPVTVAARVIADVPIVTRDAFVMEGSDDRYYVWSITEAAAWMCVPVVYSLEIRLAPRSDVLYEYPLERPPDEREDYQTTTVINL